MEWDSVDNDQISLQLLYPEITLHAIARDDATIGGRPCIYLQLTNTSLYLNGSHYECTDENGNAKLDDNNGDDEDFMEMRLVPEMTSRGMVDDLFAALCEASAMHQDEFQEDDDEVDEDAAFGRITSAAAALDARSSGWITSENVDSFIPTADQQVHMRSFLILVHLSLFFSN